MAGLDPATQPAAPILQGWRWRRCLSAPPILRRIRLDGRVRPGHDDGGDDGSYLDGGASGWELLDAGRPVPTEADLAGL